MHRITFYKSYVKAQKKPLQNVKVLVILETK